MKTIWACALVSLLAACGAKENADQRAAQASPSGSSTAAAPPAAQGEVTDERIGIPSYPGATEAPSSRFKLSTGTGTTFTVSFVTTDSPVQVAAFYQTELAKIGTLEESINVGEQLKTVAARRPDGSLSSIRAATDGKGRTVLALYRFFPAKP